MTIDWWGLGLQAVNVLILIWLLARIFWRPVAGAIARRQAAAQSMLDAGKAAQDKADAALAEVTNTRAGIAAEREAILAEAKAMADAARKTALAQAQQKADALMAAAQTTIARETEAARKQNAAQASALSVEIATRLLAKMNTPAVQAAFLDLLIDAIAKMSASDRAALASAATRIEIVAATVPDEAEKTRIEKAVADALGGAADLHLVGDPELIAGLELRSAHFVLRNSWQADLARILKEMKDAA
ncbi:MAG: F0F1 ATP synthase subunit delta [Rhodobacteraceae bacterium]|nr:F0F1 ATP synthase subunit delta [Paracoccaceae bacterium]